MSARGRLGNYFVTVDWIPPLVSVSSYAIKTTNTKIDIFVMSRTAFGPCHLEIFQCEILDIG